MTWLAINRTISDSRRAAKVADNHVSYVTLADGQVVAVPHANLAAAKELLAMQKLALQRVEAARAQTQSRTPMVEWERMSKLELVR